MQDKSFTQAVDDMYGKLSSEFQETIFHMLQYPTTVTQATSRIHDQKVRDIVSDTLIVGQILAMLTLMRDMNILSDAQFGEFKTFLLLCLEPGQ